MPDGKREPARGHAEAALRVLHGIMTNTGNPAVARVAAAEALLRWASSVDGGKVPECDGTAEA